MDSFGRSYPLEPTKIPILTKSSEKLMGRSENVLQCEVKELLV
jgi:hypothetical protein